MDLPKFILGDNTDFPESIFIVHTEYPRFILNLENDSIKWLESFSSSDAVSYTHLTLPTTPYV